MYSECWARVQSTSSIQIECTYLHWLHFYVSAFRVSSSSVSPLFARTIVCHWVRLAARRLSIAVVAVSISKSFAFILLITDYYYYFNFFSTSIRTHRQCCCMFEQTFVHRIALQRGSRKKNPIVWIASRWINGCATWTVWWLHFAHAWSHRLSHIKRRQHEPFALHLYAFVACEQWCDKTACNRFKCDKYLTFHFSNTIFSHVRRSYLKLSIIYQLWVWMFICISISIWTARPCLSSSICSDRQNWAIACSLLFRIHRGRNFKTHRNVCKHHAALKKKMNLNKERTSCRKREKKETASGNRTCHQNRRFILIDCCMHSRMWRVHWNLNRTW